MAVEAIEVRADEHLGAVLLSMFAEADMVMQVDCASRGTNITVMGYFVFPKGSIQPGVELEQPA